MRIGSRVQETEILSLQPTYLSEAVVQHMIHHPNILTINITDYV